MRERVREVW